MVFGHNLVRTLCKVLLTSGLRCVVTMVLIVGLVVLCDGCRVYVVVSVLCRVMTWVLMSRV